MWPFAHPYSTLLACLLPYCSGKIVSLGYDGWRIKTSNADIHIVKALPGNRIYMRCVGNGVPFRAGILLPPDALVRHGVGALTQSTDAT